MCAHKIVVCSWCSFVRRFVVWHLQYAAVHSNRWRKNESRQVWGVLGIGAFLLIVILYIIFFFHEEFAFGVNSLLLQCIGAHCTPINGIHEERSRYRCCCCYFFFSLLLFCCERSLFGSVLFCSVCKLFFFISFTFLLYVLANGWFSLFLLREYFSQTTLPACLLPAFARSFIRSLRNAKKD